MLRVGLISYLPDTSVREKRRNVVHATLSDLSKVIPQDVQIHIIAQNYNILEDSLASHRYAYTYYEKGIGQCAARNALLSQFYASDDDFMLYADDDTAFHDRYNAKELFQALHDHPEWFKDIDCFTGLEGKFTPFTEENSKLGLDDKWVFKPMQFATSGEFRVLKNLRKYYNKEFYYDSGLKYGEDLHFRLKYLSQINSFVCRNVICKSRGHVDGVCTLDEITYTDQNTFYTQVTNDVYDMFDIPINKKGNRDLSQFRCKIPYISVSISDGSVSTDKSSSKVFELF